ncbi:hypothetical protein Tco_1055295 [Tanacetum coccineum]|uniref:Uncharacterized protein n=1 Tax=Tanacetum coccineum TaxID=301880 RepID=A0ABQ5GZ73_9ASTR
MSGGPSTTPKGKKVKAEGKEKSEWWQYYEVLYEKDEDGNRRKIAKCKYCETRLVADNELESKVEDMVEEVKTKIGELFGTYKERFDFLSSNSSMGEHMESEVTSPNNGDNDFLNDYYNVDATSSYETETDFLISIAKMRSARSVIAKLIFSDASYFIWQEWNYRIFKKSKRSPNQIIDIIKSTVHLKLITCKFKRTNNDDLVVEYSPRAVLFFPSPMFFLPGDEWRNKSLYLLLHGKVIVGAVRLTCC